MADSRTETRMTAKWTRADWFALVAVTAGAALLRFYAFARPPEQVFDERTYVKDACFYVHAAGRPPCFDREITTVHPPLGKWLIGWGIEATDFSAVGWRIAAALAGVITVALLYVLGRRLLGSTWAALLAAGFLAVDFMHFVHSRVGMLDIFVPMFGTAAFLFLVCDRDRTFAPAGRARKGWSRGGWRPWRIAAGVACGLAVASKWSGLLVLATIVLLTVVWEMKARPRDSLRAAFNDALTEEGGSIVIALVLIPVVVYGATFVGRLDGSYLAWPWNHGSFYRALWDRQFYMYKFHRYLATPNWAQSPVWSWPLVTRPIPYLFERLPGGRVRNLVGGADPFVWWAALVALGYTAYEWWKRKEPLGPEGVIVAGFAIGYFPWFVLSYNRPDVFIYYMLPVVPFMCLALAYAAQRLWRSVPGRVAVIGFAVLAIGLFAYEYPLLTARPISAAGWHERMWFYDGCQDFLDRPATLGTEVAGFQVQTPTTLSNYQAGTPVPAWCGL